MHSSDIHSVFNDLQQRSAATKRVPGRALAAALSAGAVMASLPFLCSAQTFPSQPLKLVVPYTAGGAADVIARPLSQALGEVLGQSVLVDNRPGANTIVGAEVVARSAPDGYTLFLGTDSALAVNPAAYKKLPYDALKDFVGVAKVVSNYHLIVARKGFGPNNVAELVAYAKANPGKVSYGSTGYGSPTHFGGMLVESMAGLKMLHVPYKGISQVVTDLLGETLDISAVGPSAVTSQVKAGKLKPFAATSEKRLSSYPDVPSMHELGYTGFTSGASYLIVARAGTPAPIVSRLNRDINAVLQKPAVKSLLEAEEFSVEGNMTPAQVAKYIADQYVRWGKIVRDAKISFD